jgi:hypothetical protein
MPRDPQECRQHALYWADLDWADLPKNAVSPQAPQTFLTLSEAWLKLAKELADAQTFSDAVA